MLFLLFQVTSKSVSTTPTPNLRVYIVATENRTNAISYENRISTIESEDRINIIKGV